MPLEIQKEYAAALGLKLPNMSLNQNQQSQSKKIGSTSANPIIIGVKSSSETGGTNSRKRSLGSLTNKASTSKGKAVKKSNNRTTTENKAPVITIDDFFR